MNAPSHDTLARLEKAQEFSKRIYHEYGNFIKSIVFFGSSSRADQEKESDIDVMVIVDDVTVPLGFDIVETYRLSVHTHVKEVSSKLHVTTLKLSLFWELLRAGDPVALNILREGVAIIDSGFFDPFKTLLERGKIMPSAEAITTYDLRAERSFSQAKWHVNQATIDLYWSVIDAAHATLMRKGTVPPRPEMVGSALGGILSKKECGEIGEFVATHRSIMKHRKQMSGAQFDALAIKAHRLIEKLKRV